MVTALLVGLVVEFVLAMPPSPTAIAIIRQARAGHEHDDSAMEEGAGRAAARAYPPGSGAKPYKREGRRLLPLNPTECAFFFSSAIRTTGAGNLRKFVRRTNISKFV